MDWGRILRLIWDLPSFKYPRELVPCFCVTGARRGFWETLAGRVAKAMGLGEIWRGNTQGQETSSFKGKRKGRQVGRRKSRRERS